MEFTDVYSTEQKEVEVLPSNMDYYLAVLELLCKQKTSPCLCCLQCEYVQRIAGMPVSNFYCLLLKELCMLHSAVMMCRTDLAN